MYQAVNGYLRAYTEEHSDWSDDSDNLPLRLQALLLKLPLRG